MPKNGQAQVLMYGIVGVSVNMGAYMAYLGLTFAGVEPKLAMTVVYVLAVLLGFVLNRLLTFNYRGPTGPALLRHWTAYLIGYLINLVALWVLVDSLGMNHQAVQAVMILVLAVILFLLQRHWVFRPQSGRINLGRRRSIR